ncbi:MAG TPA: extracellular solute-binding protein [Candidatus Binatia bacterium]|nr:extracellular solute-binding protein [Candidatus Binatia bacterium]
MANAMRLLTFFIVSLSCLGARAFAQSDAEAILARVNALPLKQRADVLVAEARKEGVIEWYGSLLVPEATQIIDKFRQRYPFLEVRYGRGSGTQVINRFLTESKAGSYKADVIGARSNFHPTLMKAGLVAKNLAPFRQELREGFTDSAGYLAGQHTFGLVIGYNTRNILPNKIPQSYQDLLSPEWKGQMALDLESHDWLAGILDTLGDEKGMDFAKKLATQNVHLQRGHSLLLQLVAAGELKIEIDAYHYQILEFRKKGAPLDFTVPDPMVVKEPSGIWIPKRAPHPHAAALLVDFLFSREGQQILAGLSVLVARKDIAWDFGGKPLKGVHVLSAEKWGSKYNDLVRQFDEIFRKAK